MKKVFNLKQFRKQAYYEDGRGYSQRNTRAWTNCIKSKMDGEGKSAQEAHNDCIKEYNEWEKDKWLFEYTKCDADSNKERIVNC
ncbi:MAG: hypothetical protein ACOCUV_01565 [bacterium]